MIQSVSCPSCDTHYGLTRARVRPGLRRARCFKCATIFGIEGDVLRLLGGYGPAEEAASAPTPTDAFAFIQPDAFDELDAASLHAVEDLEPLEPLESIEPIEPTAEAALEPLAEDTDLELPSLEELEAATAAIEPDDLRVAQGALGDVLSADDLAGSDDEILDKTLVDFEAPPHPEARPTPAPLPPLPEEEATSTHGGYASAKDAIHKLLGETPPPPAAYRPPSHRGGTTMDVEATLTALESTLGGVPAPRLEPAPLAPVDLPSPAGATMKLTREEMNAAIAAMAAPPAPPPPAPRLAPSESTVMLKMPVSEVPQPSMDPNLLKVQMGTELYSNLSMEQLVSLAEQGRLAEYHMVARQFSDNWLEAAKVPGLRPVFDRLRRTRLPEPPPSPLETAPIKKSLFGGLFGKN